jgi:hypothetical protein
MGEIMRGKYDFDPADHYARPDVFSLSFDDWPKHAVISSKMGVSKKSFGTTCRVFLSFHQTKIVDSDTILKVNFS